MIEPLFKRWSVDLARSLDLSNSAEDRIALIVSISQFFRLTAAIAVLGIGAFLVLKQELSPGAILAGSVILARSLAPLEQAMGAWRLFVDARLAKNRLGSLFATADEEHSATAFPFSIPQGAACQIDFSGVSLWFERQEMPVLKNVDVSLHSGKIAALIGPSGGGKSTFCRLLLGIQAPSAGTIRLNGIPAEMLSNSDRSRLFGYLPQQVEFFPGTIKDNIARMEAGASERDVTRAAMLCSVHEMILSLPRGYDTWLDEGAWRLSGGQRQRIGLARAVYGDPMFVILDEPNANLDATGEHALRGAIMTLKQQGAAVLIVDHRHSTLSYADDVFLLEAGLVQMRDPRDIALQRHDGVDRMLVSQ
jgi:ABC-type protease/lipase transport system fused ATPase/permease subunit